MIAEGRAPRKAGAGLRLWGVAYYVAIAGPYGQSAIRVAGNHDRRQRAERASLHRSGGRRPETTRGARHDGDLGRHGHLHISSHGSARQLWPPGRTHRNRHRWRHAGCSQCASSIILKWKVQFVCAIVWWAAAVSSCFLSENQRRHCFPHGDLSSARSSSASTE